MKARFWNHPILWSAVAGLAPGALVGQASLTRGLWVGEITLDRVVEVTVPLDANNNPVGPDPQTPTKTFDEASLRVIVHVNGAGQASLLKDVAILSRKAPGALGVAEIGSEFDLALVTDASLFAEFPPQPAKRLASAVFDFGDAEAIKAVDAIVSVAAEAAAQSANSATGDLDDEAVRTAAIASATQAGVDAVDNATVADLADRAASFDNFLRNFLNRGAIDALAGGGSVPAAVTAEAQRLASGVNANDVLGRPVSFLADRRATDMIASVQGAIAEANAAGSDPAAAAQNAAAGFADLGDAYGRFLAGASFGIPQAGGTTGSGNLLTVISDAAGEGAAAKLADDDVGEAVKGGPGGVPAPPAAVSAAIAEALRIQVALYDDTRARAAIDAILDAIVAAANASTTVALSDLEAELRAAGEAALENDVFRSVTPAGHPTATYTEFIRSGSGFNANEKFTGAAARAAAAAADAAVTEKRNPLGNLESIRAQAFLAAVEALDPVYGAAARAIRHEQPLEGSLEPGGTVTGTIMLPANHPTNPFRHRRHPDHTIGRTIERRLTFEVDGTAGDGLERVGFGVDRLAGEFTEEIFGLHKPLGPGRDTGLKVAGRFELSRISLIDALNAR